MINDKNKPSPGLEKIAKKEQISQINLFLLKYFRLLTIAALVLFCLVSFLYLLKPKYDSIRTDIAESYENKQAEYEQLENYQRNLNQYINVFRNLSQGDRDRISLMLPENDSYKEFYYYFEEVVGQSNMILKSLEIKLEDASPLAVKKTVSKKTEEEILAERLGKIEIKVDIVGVSYGGLKSLLSVLENNIRIMDVDKVSFEPVTRSATLEILAYYLRPAENQ